MSGFFFPQAFLTGARQNFARKNAFAIDELSFETNALDEVSNPRELRQPPDVGVYVYGIFMEGARWNRLSHEVDESHPKELFVEMPALHFLPVRHRVPPEIAYRCP